MASQIAHIVYAKKYFEKLEDGTLECARELEKFNFFPLPNLDKDEFLLGCVFPDIRRIEPAVKRKDTHLCFSPLDLNFSELSSFQAGWKFHLFCDMRREEILNRHNFYSLPKAAELAGLPAKMLEDELVYDKYNNWEKINHFFNHPIIFETGLELSQETFAFWYAILARYVEKKPEEKTRRIFFSKQPGLIAKVDVIAGIIAELRKSKKVLEILEKVSEEII